MFDPHDLEPKISSSSVFGNNNKWCVAAKRSQISAHIVWRANRKPSAASSNSSLHLTLDDLEPQISRSSVFGNNDKLCVVAKRSEIGAQIVWEATRKPYAASSNPCLHLTLDDLEPQISRSSFFGQSDKWRVVAKQFEISAHIVWGATRKPYAASSNQPLYLTWVDLETHNSRSSILEKNFLDRATDQTESARSAHNGSKDAISRREVPFGG